ncbi:hypothetical protein LG307_14755 [Sutcliffiella horikoshii]|uniref:hypothetical protein n=1 Tax=Sutcliffiella horikoshii TaxID=79883 RepID=UPI00384EEE84
MNATIYNYLASDLSLCSLLNHMPSQKSHKIFMGRPQNIYNNPALVNEKGSFIEYPYIIFDVLPLDNNVVTQFRVKVTTIVSDDLQIDAITKRLNEILDFNKPNISRPSNIVNGTTILHSQLISGGNFLYHDEEKLFEQIQYFLVKVKG